MAELNCFQDLLLVAGVESRAGSVCLNSFGRFAKWISASIMPPPSLGCCHVKFLWLERSAARGYSGDTGRNFPCIESFEPMVANCLRGAATGRNRKAIAGR
ncbi:hypothetical protein EHH54_37285 [Rhizobium leguminosarum]|nr:hypothetical protein EHH54_42140 [Rhizobium leguminosarum]RWX24222.1 hypothetical protein EHH54_37285 [Rhizobium leguminosarum]